MGAWGDKLYENDTALDVKDQFEEQISLGKNAEDITQQLISDFDCEMDAPLSQLVFWLALADTQWNWGRLQPDVKDRALCCIKEYETENPAISAVQRNELDRLQSKLLSPQPHSKKPVKKRIYRCKWKKGDVFAYKLESNLAKEVGLWGTIFPDSKSFRALLVSRAYHSDCVCEDHKRKAASDQRGRIQQSGICSDMVYKV